MVRGPTEGGSVHGPRLLLAASHGRARVRDLQHRRRPGGQGSRHGHRVRVGQGDPGDSGRGVARLPRRERRLQRPVVRADPGGLPGPVDHHRRQGQASRLRLHDAVPHPADGGADQGRAGPGVPRAVPGELLRCQAGAQARGCALEGDRRDVPERRAGRAHQEVRRGSRAVPRAHAGDVHRPVRASTVRQTGPPRSRRHEGPVGSLQLRICSPRS